MVLIIFPDVKKGFQYFYLVSASHKKLNFSEIYCGNRVRILKVLSFNIKMTRSLFSSYEYIYADNSICQVLKHLDLTINKGS